jgi:hypothetical protein
VLRVLADVYTDKLGAEGATPYHGDPRLNLKKCMKPWSSTSPFNWR